MKKTAFFVILFGAFVISLTLSFIPFKNFLSIGFECYPGNPSCSHHYGWPIHTKQESDVLQHGLLFVNEHFVPAFIMDVVIWYLFMFLIVKIFSHFKREKEVVNNAN